MNEQAMIRSDGEAEYDATRAEHELEIARWESDGGAVLAEGTPRRPAREAADFEFAY